MFKFLWTILSMAICYNKRGKTMRKDYATKTIIIRIFGVLQKYTSKKHPVSITSLQFFYKAKGNRVTEKPLQEM